MPAEVGPGCANSDIALLIVDYSINADTTLNAATA